MRRSRNARRALHASLIVCVLSSMQCGGPSEPAVPPTLSIAGGNGLSAAVGTGLGTPPTVKAVDKDGNPVAGLSVTFAVASGGGTITGPTQTTSAVGLAAVGSWVMGTALGANSLTATATATGSPITFTATAIPGPPANLAINAGNAQTVQAGSAVAVAPSVVVTDIGGNAVTGATVTFAIATGGGSITGGSQTTNSSGIATIGSWVPGAVGSNTLTATVTGVAGNVTFTATGQAGLVSISSITPATLVPGASATINGAGFSATPALNTVTIDGVSTTVTAASTTQLTVTVPVALPCEATHDASVSVTTAAGSGALTKPLQAARQRSLAVGELLIIPASESRCNEFPNPGSSTHYLVNVYNTSTSYNTTGAAFQLRGAAGSGAAGLSPGGASRIAAQDIRGDAAKRAMAQRRSAPDEGAALHLKVLEFNTRILNEQRGRTPRRTGGANRAAAVPAVGDPMTVKVPNINSSNACTNFFTITGRVAYVGTRSIIVEDNANPIKNIDTTYAQIGTEFDNVMYPILEANYGNPFPMDAQTDNNQREIMVFTNVVNTNFTGLAGFVIACDLYPVTTYSGSNVGEYFYATAPTSVGTLATAGITSPPKWRWAMRGTIIHESKHIASVSARKFQNALSFEESWLEETTARLSEELYDRQVNGFNQKANIVYGSAGNLAGPYCGVRPNVPACGDKPRGIVRVFEELQTSQSGTGWFSDTEDHSPIGRRDANDFSFYATGWSFLRWAIDHSAMSEAAFLTALNQETVKTGVANLEARTGRTFADMIPEWLFANALDEYPGFVPALTRLTQPSWQFRNVFAGLQQDFPTFYTTVPFSPFNRGFGAFIVDSHALPGTGSFIDLSGTGSAKQLIELKAATGTAGAPAELRIAIVRIQ